MDTPQEPVNATLCFVTNKQEVLLIMKKRGFGEGKLNGPGGKVGKNEKIMEAAIRETEEETGIKPINPVKRGILDFYFGKVNVPQWRVHVFYTENFEGNLYETEEAKGQWISIDKIPYNRMWEDDKHWLPFVLNGKSVQGEFWFTRDMEKLLTHKLEVVSELRDV
jgi:8-oxo-dGTP pyrophosphatase MutT (NUDIX family)